MARQDNWFIMLYIQIYKYIQTPYDGDTVTLRLLKAMFIMTALGTRIKNAWRSLCVRVEGYARADYEKWLLLPVIPFDTLSALKSTSVTMKIKYKKMLFYSCIRVNISLLFSVISIKILNFALNFPRIW